jgi:hypothetical protein
MTSSNLRRGADNTPLQSSTSFLEASDVSRVACWTAWLLILIAVCLIHSLTLKISPPFWVDEAQIIEHGRLAFTGTSTDWSVNWSTEKGRPVLLWAYLGPAMQELLFRATMPLPTGPRVASLLGAALAASTLIGWLISLQTGYGVSLLLGTLFLLDPLFVQSYRGGRIDSWVLAACIGSCWLLRLTLSRMQVEKPYVLSLFSAGLLVATAFFVWPSAALCYPFVIAELGVVLRKQYLTSRRFSDGVLRSVITFAGGVLIAGIVCIVPVRHMLGDIIRDVITVLRESQAPYSLERELTELVRGFVFRPLLLIGTVTGLLFARKCALAWATFAAVAYLLTTRVYDYRLVYLIPYAAVLIGISLQTGFSGNMKRYRTALLVSLLSILGVSSVVSLVIRPAIAFSRRDSRNPDTLFRLGQQALGAGPYRVYVDPWEFYFVGRELGWRMFRQYGHEPDDTRLPPVLLDVDFCVFRRERITPRLTAIFAQSGLQLLHPIRLLSAGGNQTEDSFVDSLGGQGYGDYVLVGRLP